jgi:uncharacterized protein (TIGR00661 family)
LQSSKNILVVVSNQGIGYAQGSIEIINQLVRAGFLPIIASNGTALAILHEEFPFLTAIRITDYTVNYLNSSKKKKYKNTLNALSLIWHYWIERKIIAKLCRENQIKGIIAVGRFGACSKKLPSILIAHQLNLLKETSTELTNYIHAQFLKAFNECWITDIYKSPNLSGFIGHQQQSKLNLRYLGVISRFHQIDTQLVYDVTVLITAKEPFRSKMEEELLLKFQDFSGKVQIISTKFEEPHRSYTNGGVTITNFLFTRDLQRVLNQSKMVVANSDYNTVLDLARLDKKCLFIPDESDSEQLYLAKRISTHKQASMCYLSEFSLAYLMQAEDNKGFQNFYTEPHWETLFKVFDVL